MLRGSIRRSRAIDQIVEGLEVEELAPGEKLPDHTASAEESKEKDSKKKTTKKATKKSTKKDDKEEEASESDDE